MNIDMIKLKQIIYKYIVYSFKNELFYCPQKISNNIN